MARGGFHGKSSRTVVGQAKIRVSVQRNTAHISIGDANFLILDVGKRKYSWGYKRPRGRAIDITSIWPRLSYKMYTIEDAMDCLFSLGVQDFNWLYKMLKEQGWEDDISGRD